MVARGRHNGILLTGNDNEIYGHFTCVVMMRLQYVEHRGDRMFEAVCKLGLEGIVSKKLDAPYKSGPSKAWLKTTGSYASYRRNFLAGCS